MSDGTYEKIIEHVKRTYFSFLCDQIVDEDHSNYFMLLSHLFDKEFYWLIPNDDNRASDGKQLRVMCIGYYDFGVDANEVMDILDGPCRMLELLVALATRVDHELLYDFENPDFTPYWFWTMIKNLGLEDCTDDNYDEKTANYISGKLDDLLERRYEKDGFGGLFPLKKPMYDQRKTEIWYQLNAYLLENYEI